MKRTTNGKQRQQKMFLEAHWLAEKWFYFTIAPFPFARYLVVLGLNKHD